jgi:uncharacterized protein (DUF2147 family)
MPSARLHCLSARSIGHDGPFFFLTSVVRNERVWLALWQPFRIALLTAALSLFTPRVAATGDILQGEWLLDGRVVVQIFDCADKVCGRILWLKVPRDPQGQLVLDKNNPNPALRNRPLCGLTILWNLQLASSDRWEDGWFYNPDDGRTYRVTAQLESSDTIIARIYVGVPLFGKTKTLGRYHTKHPQVGAEC